MKHVANKAASHTGQKTRERKVSNSGNMSFHYWVEAWEAKIQYMRTTKNQGKQTQWRSRQKESHRPLEHYRKKWNYSAQAWSHGHAFMEKVIAEDWAQVCTHLPVPTREQPAMLPVAHNTAGKERTRKGGYTENLKQNEHKSQTTTEAVLLERVVFWQTRIQDDYSKPEWWEWKCNCPLLQNYNTYLKQKHTWFKERNNLHLKLGPFGGSRTSKKC